MSTTTTSPEPYFLQYMSDTRAYHNQKESMAYAGFVLQLAIAGSVAIADCWPPEWIHDQGWAGRLSAVVALLVLWLFLHVMMTWHLQLRDWASVETAALTSLLTRWHTTPPTADELALKQTSPSVLPLTTRLRNSIWPSAPVHLFDFLDAVMVPSALLAARCKQSAQGTATNTRYLALGSVGAGAVELTRTAFF